MKKITQGEDDYRIKKSVKNDEDAEERQNIEKRTC